MYISALHNKKQFHHLTPRKRACNTMPLKSTCCGITFNIHAFFATTEDFASNLWLWGKLFFDLNYNWFVKMAATHCNCKFSWWTHSVEEWTKILITYSVPCLSYRLRWKLNSRNVLKSTRTWKMLLSKWSRPIVCT